MPNMASTELAMSAKTKDHMYGHVFDFVPSKAKAHSSQDVERSPQDSPITLKKKLRRLSPQSTLALESSKSTTNLLRRDIIGSASHVVLETIPAVGEKKILRRRSLSTPVRRNRNRHIQFNDKVTVYELDENGDNVCTKCEALLRIDGPRSPLYALIRKPRSYNALKNASNSLVIYSNSDDFYLEDSYSIAKSMDLHYPQDSPRPLVATNYLRDITQNSNVKSSASGAKKDTTSNTLTHVSDIPDGKLNDVIPRKQMPPSEPGKINISFVPSTKAGTKLKFVVYLGAEYDPNNIVVKACTNGTKVRVQAITHRERSTEVREFNEKYTLPMAVDPYTVEARLDTNGYLTIEAVLQSAEKTRNLRWTTENMSASLAV